VGTSYKSCGLRGVKFSLWSFYRPSMKGKEIMKNVISTTLKAGVAALILVAASGCVSQKSVDEAKATADKAVQDAAAAKAAADAAASAAQSAKSSADSAQSAANQALQAAQASQACCDATNEKIDRAFKKSVSK
jgi:Alanine-zipper, major outer membrane lipoprotein